MRDRLAAESTEEREVRLEQMSIRQRERLAAESIEAGGCFGDEEKPYSQNASMYSS